MFLIKKLTFDRMNFLKLSVRVFCLAEKAKLRRTISRTNCQQNKITVCRIAVSALISPIYPRLAIDDAVLFHFTHQPCWGITLASLPLLSFVLPFNHLACSLWLLWGCIKQKCSNCRFRKNWRDSSCISRNGCNQYYFWYWWDSCSSSCCSFNQNIVTMLWSKTI